MATPGTLLSPSARRGEMSSTTSVFSAATSREALSSKPERLMSLDLFRGLTVAAMILVNDPGDGPSAYAPLKHSVWNGWTPTDLVFPFFLFIVGVAMAFSFRSRLDRGESRSRLLQHVLWRGLVLFALGVFLNGFPNHYHLATLRIYGVLQRIAICYVITALLELWTGWRTQIAVALACLAGYWILMRYVSVPGFGVPTHDIPLLDPDRNVVAWLDRKLLMGHLYERTRDPEGVLSNIPSVATCLLGLLTGKWMKTANSARIKTVAMIAAGICAVVLGRTMHLWFPINKKLWTSSFVLLTAGLALIFLATLYWLSDVKQHRGLWTRPILVFGTNAIAAYFLSEALAATLDSIAIAPGGSAPVTIHDYAYTHWFAPLGTPANASLLYALAYVALCWLPIALLHRKGISIKA
jgi:predicted acyltransferase